MSDYYIRKAVRLLPLRNTAVCAPAFRRVLPLSEEKVSFV